MDFAQLETKSGAEAGAFMHLKHPAYNTPLWDETVEPRKPIGLMVRGTESRFVQDRLKSLQREQVKGADAEDTGLDFVSSLVMSFIGVEHNGRPLSAQSPDDLKLFFGLSDSFVEQVIAFAKDRSNFFGQPSLVSPSRPGKSAS